MMDNGYQDKRESVTNQRMAELYTVLRNRDNG